MTTVPPLLCPQSSTGPHTAPAARPLGAPGSWQGPDLHYRDRPLTAQPPCRPNPDRHMARQNTLEQTPSLSTQCTSFFPPIPGSCVSILVLEKRVQIL